MPDTLVELVRAKYPGAYDDLDDLTLDALVREKHPGVYDDLPPPKPNFRVGNAVDAQGNNVVTNGERGWLSPSTLNDFPLINAAKGVGAGAMSTIYHGGDLVRRALGMERVIDTPEAQAAMKPPDGMSGKIGFYGEQAAEFGVPLARIARITKGLPILQRMGVEAATSAGVAGIQSGGDSGAMGVSAALGGALPVVGKAARFVGGTARRAAAGAQEGGVGGAVAAAVRRVVPSDTRTMLVQGLKPRATKTGFEGSLGRAVPEIKASEAELGKAIESVDDLLAATKIAKKRVRAQYDEMAGPMREMGTTVDLSDMADEMVRSIPKKTRIEDPQRYADIVARADQYRRPFKLEDAEQILRETNAELDAYYSKFPQAQRKALDANPETAQLEAQGRALRDAIYKRLDDPGQGDAARELNRRYGALLDVEDAAYRRSIVAKRQQPESLGEQVGAIHAAKDFARAGFKTMRGDLMGAGMDLMSGAAMRDTSRFLKEQQTADALVKRAFAAYRGGGPAAVQMPVRRPVRGLLEKGSTPLGPGPDPSYVRGERGSYPVSERRALPPARTVREGQPSPDTSYVRSEPAQYGEKWTPPAAPPEPVAAKPQPLAPKPVTSKTPQLPPPLPKAAYQTPQTRTESAPVRRARALREERQQRDEMAAAAPKPTPSEKAATPAQTVKPTAPAQAPAKAADKVVNEIERVIDVSGAKSAKEIQDRIIGALHEEMEKSRSVSGIQSSRFDASRSYGGREGRVFINDEYAGNIDRYGEVKVDEPALNSPTGTKQASLGRVGKDLSAKEHELLAQARIGRHIADRAGAGRISIRIPGDGIFTIERNPVAIAEVIRRVKKSGSAVWKDLKIGK